MESSDDWHFSLPLVPFYLPAARFRARYALQIDFPSRKLSAEVHLANVNHTILLSNALLHLKWTHKTACWYTFSYVSTPPEWWCTRKISSLPIINLCYIRQEETAYTGTVLEGTVLILTTRQTKNATLISISYLTLICDTVSFMTELNFRFSDTEIEFSYDIDLTHLHKCDSYDNPTPRSS